FQQIEVDECIERESTIRLFGVTEAGNGVLCHVFGFLPYFYFPAPSGFRRDDLEEYKRPHLISYPPSYPLQLQGQIGNAVDMIDCEIVERQDIYGYSGDVKSPFVKVTLRLPRLVSRARTIMESGATFPGAAGRTFTGPFTTYESNLGFMLRFMIDTKVTGANWIELPPGTYKMRPFPTSHCQIENVVIFTPSDTILYLRITSYDKFISHAPEGEWSKIAPLRILSFDIECAGRKGVFPEPEIDPVIQIANVVTIQGGFLDLCLCEPKPFIRNVFTLNSCAHIAGTQTLEFYDEKELLQRWRDFVVEVDPDVVIGYNISNFDFPYLLDRAANLGVRRFPYFGRIKRTHKLVMWNKPNFHVRENKAHFAIFCYRTPDIKTEAKDTKFSSKAYGTRESKQTNMEGRLQLDMLQVMHRDYKLRSYTLNAVCAHFLGEQKEDVHHSMISELQNGNNETRRRLAIYCLKVTYIRYHLQLQMDAFLPLRLMDKLMCLYNYIEMARVTGVPFNYLLARGQQVKVISQLYRKANEEGLVIPAMKSEGA
ncbi:LOW QUALITY PROTEIN: ribonuclease H-like domain-containing protein, partial [Jimgerdemannia flammicorona]